MRKQEIFALVAGILGFIVDIIGLATFFTDVPLARPNQSLSTFPRTWGILLLVYGWFLVSWSLAQWKIARRDDYLLTATPGLHETPVTQIVFVIVMVVGFLLLPIAFLIVADFLRDVQGDKPFDLERIVDLIFFSFVSMGLTGVVVFAVTYGLLSIVNDEEGVEL